MTAIEDPEMAETKDTKITIMKEKDGATDNGSQIETEIGREKEIVIETENATVTGKEIVTSAVTSETRALAHTVEAITDQRTTTRDHRTTAMVLADYHGVHSEVQARSLVAAGGCTVMTCHEAVGVVAALEEGMEEGVTGDGLLDPCP